MFNLYQFKIETNKGKSRQLQKLELCLFLSDFDELKPLNYLMVVIRILGY